MKNTHIKFIIQKHFSSSIKNFLLQCRQTDTNFDHLNKKKLKFAQIYSSYATNYQILIGIRKCSSINKKDNDQFMLHAQETILLSLKNFLSHSCESSLLQDMKDIFHNCERLLAQMCERKYSRRNKTDTLNNLLYYKVFLLLLFN